MKKYNEIQGWFDYADVYDYLVSTIPNSGIFVEGGAWLGSSSSYLCDIANDRIQVFIVDSWLGSSDELNTTHKLATQTDIYEIFLQNMGNRKFIPIRKNSIDASKNFNDESCDVVFIDMGHSYEDVINDLRAWYPKVKNGGYIAGHDIDKDGVKIAVTEFFKNNYNNIGTRCWISQKVKK